MEPGANLFLEVLIYTHDFHLLNLFQQESISFTFYVKNKIA